MYVDYLVVMRLPLVAFSCEAVVQMAAVRMRGFRKNPETEEYGNYQRAPSIISTYL